MKGMKQIVLLCGMDAFWGPIMARILRESKIKFTSIYQTALANDLSPDTLSSIIRVKILDELVQKEFDGDFYVIMTCQDEHSEFIDKVKEDYNYIRVYSIVDRIQKGYSHLIPFKGI